VFDDAGGKVVAPFGGLRCRQAVGQAKQCGSCKRVPCPVGVDCVYCEAFDETSLSVFDYVATSRTVGDEGLVADLCHLCNAMLDVIAAEKLFRFVSVTEHDIAVVVHNSAEVVRVSADQERVGKSERRFDAQLV